MYLYVSWLEIIDPDTGDVIQEGGNTTLTRLENLNFNPQVDLSGNSLPVSEYTVDVITAEDIPFENALVELRDAMNRLWSAWPVRKVQRVSENCLRLTASSWLWLLQYRELAPEMYVNKNAGQALLDCFGPEHSNDYTVSSAISGKTLNGFVPGQNARERMTWLLFVLGAYVQDVYRSNALIAAVDDTTTLIPLERTFMRQNVDAGDWVTGLKIKLYEFRQAATEEEWQADGNSYMFPLPWLATEVNFEITNPLAPYGVPENVVEIAGIYLINAGNVSDIVSRLARYWFNPTEAQMDVINNRAYKPGDLVTAYTAVDSLVTGYIQQASFRFGVQARSTLKLVGANAVQGAKLTVNYTYEGGVIGRQTYYLPVGTTYSLSNPYIDRLYQSRRYVYRPQADAVTGTIVDGDNTATQAYDLALEYRDERLYVYSVDAVTKQESGGKYTGVIS